MSTYGRRGGDGPTAGKKASTYTAILPDGRKARKRSYDVHTDEAIMMVYQDRQSAWHVAAVKPLGTVWASDYTPLSARRV